MSEVSLYDKYGGFATIHQVVIKFYDALNANEEVSHYFDRIDLEGLISHQTKFLCQVLGGPAEYSGRELKTAHEPLKINEHDFGVVAGVLQEVLVSSGVEAVDVETIMGVVGSTKDQIVSV